PLRCIIHDVGRVPSNTVEPAGPRLMADGNARIQEAFLKHRSKKFAADCSGVFNAPAKWLIRTANEKKVSEFSLHAQGNGVSQFQVPERYVSDGQFSNGRPDGGAVQKCSEKVIQS